MAGSIPTQPPNCPPADSRRSAARAGGPGPRATPGSRREENGTRPRHPQTTGSGQNDPRNPEHGNSTPGGDARGSTGFIADPRPPR